MVTLLSYKVKMEIAATVTDRTAAGIAAAVGRLINSGDLPVGERLPTVRVLARDLGVSPATVSQAWQRLLQAGLVRTDGRRGTTVREPAALSGPTRFGRLHPEHADSMLDLSESVPDPLLLPDISSALARISQDNRQTSYFDTPVLPDLEEVLRADWPFEPAMLTIVDGAMDAVDRLLAEHLRPGRRVIVENPTFPPILDLLELLGCEVVGLSVDDRGIHPDALRAAIRQRDADLVILQPRGQNPSGHSMDPARCAALASVLADSQALLLEDDHSAGICLAEPVSLGTHLPERTIHVRGFSKSHGPDLRLAAVGGAEAPIASLMRRRLLGPGWSSRLLQDVLLTLLTDPASMVRLEQAKREYATRRSSMRDALAARGVQADGRDGSNLWVTVRSEQEALVSLALNSIAVAPGSAFTSAPLAQSHLRVACAPINQRRADEVADLIAQAATTVRRR